ncbi:ABC transporter ATP-binding protein [Microbacterium sp. SSW1-59]|uniref:ABC transporter ATP-binding protein n=1 Tax=Microbacterium xanthum TaxID=3079794 RepID=UPI002AD48B36|nr:ABC transporter ATP-binding protein [Microbacterium sp. SSW1-59]MDZ8200101.1 ABC transporter ATP-binding protein [Microbacterium sp. SSW1-59]
MEQIAVRVENLRKHYGRRAAVEDVSFEIRRGETFALLGPNGAGKSTTVEILEGYRRRTSGEVRVLGHDPARGDAAFRSRIGVVLQSAGELGPLTVREQVTQFAGFYPNARDVDEVIAAVGLTEHAGRRVSKLSGGQQRRVDVALGIVGRPEVLFLDEPTTGFDPAARRSFWELIRSLSADGVTIVLTTHYLDEAAHLADRVGIIAEGRLRAVGGVHDIGGPDIRTPVVRWREGGDLRELRTAEPGRAIAELVDRSGAEPADLQVIRPTLEDVYLDLVATPRAAETTQTEGVR